MDNKIKYKISPQDNSSVRLPTGTEGFSSEAPLYAFFERVKSGELVIEAVLILPIFLMILFSMISFMGIYGLQTQKLTELCQSAKNLGAYTAIGDNITETVTVPAVYRFQMIFPVMPFRSLYMENHVSVRCWIGEEEEGAAGEEEQMVYVTENGSVFHSRDCSYIQPDVITEVYTNLGILRNHNGAKYTACQKCAKNMTSGVIYITGDGNRYHCSASCSSLNHVVIMMKYSEAIRDKRPCSRCGGGIS